MRRSDILAAATKVFGRKGFANAHAEEIAAAAHIAKGTLYLYFKSKEAIYTAAVTQAVRELQEEVALRSTGTAGFRNKLETAIRVRLEFWPAHEAIYRLLMTVGREAHHRKQTNEVLRSSHESFLAIFRESAASETMAEADLVALAWATLDMVRGANERRMDRLSTTTTAQDADWITECILKQMNVAQELR